MVWIFSPEQYCNLITPVIRSLRIQISQWNWVATKSLCAVAKFIATLKESSANHHYDHETELALQVIQPSLQGEVDKMDRDLMDLWY